MASSVGKDELGRKALEALEQHRVDTSCVSSSDRPTGQVLVELDASGSASYNFAADTAWDNLAWSEGFARLAARTNAVCFGTLGQRSDLSRATIRRFVAATPVGALRIFDINLRPPYYSDAVIRESLELANVLKLNDELPVVATLCGLGGSAADVMQQLASRFELQAVALTRGHDGAVLARGREVHEQPGIHTEVIDTVGAGDAFTAALALGLLRQDDLAAVNQRACRVAAYVCSQSGATPAIPADI
jgi:fructokinase